jgi:DNA-directed RNA polymerase subunit RPC12/RpoP
MICEKCNNIIDEDSKFCTKCGERILVKAEELDTVFNNKNEDNKKYQKIGGFLIVCGIFLVFGLFLSFVFLGQYLSVEYEEDMKYLYSYKYSLYEHYKIIKNLSIFAFFWLFALNISFFTKNVYTKNIAIGYVAYVIFINFYTVIFHTNNGFFSVIANEIPKMVIQTILLSIFTVYFLVSKRVKYTFIEKEEKNNFENAREEYLKEYNKRKNISNK